MKPLGREADIIKLQKVHIEPMSRMLAWAFNDNPISSYLYPDALEREVKLPYTYKVPLCYGMRYGEAHITSNQLEGAAVWLPKDKSSMSFWRFLLSGAIWPGLKMGREAGRKIDYLDKYLAKKREELAPFDYWYLILLGVTPHYQGKGYASKLLRGMLVRTDEMGVPCYLETETEKNVSMYQHFGFKVIDEFIFKGIRDKLVAMLREPKSES
jgi:ribosomal protein S18 acetylase RimI-like enzyme